MDILKAAMCAYLRPLQACRPPITHQDRNFILSRQFVISNLTLKEISWLHANGTLRKYTQLCRLQLDLDLAELSAEERQTFPTAWRAFLKSISEARQLRILNLHSVCSRGLQNVVLIKKYCFPVEFM